MTHLARSVQLLAGVVLLLVTWELVGRTEVLGSGFAALSDVLRELTDADAAGVFGPALLATSRSALAAFGIGGGLGLAMAALRQTVAPVRDGVDRFAITMHAVPQIGVAPVLVVTVGVVGAPMTLGAIAAYFPAYVAATRAFSSAGPTLHDLVTVFGGRPLVRLVRLYLPAAVPGICDALRLAAPGAVLGSVIGEWFGAPAGIGLIIVSSTQNYQIDQLWAAALLSTLMAMVGFGVFSLLQTAARRRFT